MKIKLFWLALVVINTAAFDEPDPANDAGCPSTFPGFTGACSFNSDISCSYNAQPCLADTVYTNLCRCVESGSGFALSCLSADFDCGQSTVAVAIPVAVAEPNTVTTSTSSTTTTTTTSGGVVQMTSDAGTPSGDPSNDPSCPVEMPNFGDTCGGSTCRYDPITCPGDNMDTTFLTSCSCQDSGFACFSAGFACPPLPSCPATSLLGQPSATCSVPLSCGYDPVSCPDTDPNAPPTFSTNCDCDPSNGGFFQCSQFDIACPALPPPPPPPPPFNPNNPPECPPEQSQLGPCSQDTTCEYSPFSCPGSTDVLYTTSCQCGVGGFFCSSSSISCDGNERPPPTVNTYANPRNSAFCPRTSPTSDDRCFQSSLSCEYDRADCPGVDLYTTTCDCDADSRRFFCAQALVTTCPEPEPTTPSGCPLSAPDFGDSCSLGPDVNQCRYGAFSCPGGSVPSFGTRCSCNANAGFACMTLLPICAASDCPTNAPANGDPCNLDDGAFCGYDPAGCPESERPTFQKSCTCLREPGQTSGTFQCAQTLPQPCIPPPPAPSPPPPGPIFCFSGDSIVNVRGKGDIQMNTLQIGDKVHVGNDKYEPIYSFAHHAPQTLGDYLMIQTTESQHDHLKLSESHMILTPSGKHLPASNIMTGDEIVNGHGKNMIVESIKSVKSMGVFAPLTPSGKIVVNNVSASSFVAFGNDWGWKMKIVGGYEIGFSFHWMCHSFEFPHRLLCYYLGECVDEEYDEEGISMIWSSLPFGLMKWVMNQGLWLQYLCFVLTLMMVACFWLMETMMVKSPLMVACACCLAVAIGRRK